jgi:hypothetical protein
MHELNISQVELVSGGGEFADVMMSGLAGAGAARGVAAVAAVATSPAGAAAVLLIGFASGVALYYLTD